MPHGLLVWFKGPQHASGAPNKAFWAQRQYMVIGTLALILIFFFSDFLYYQGSGPGGDVFLTVNLYAETMSKLARCSATWLEASMV